MIKKYIDILEDNELKIKCPVCGATLVGNVVCQYCGTTDKQVLNASNKKVKEYRQTGNTDMIHMTTILPSDLVRWKVVLYTILLGWLGINYIYVNRPIRAGFSMGTSIACVVIYTLNLFVSFSSKTLQLGFDIIYEVIFYSMAINVVIWVFDIISVLLKKFKVPVVLASKEK